MMRENIKKTISMIMNKHKYKLTFNLYRINLSVKINFLIYLVSKTRYLGSVWQKVADSL